MIKKKILNPKRVRQIEGGFAFIPHRFLTDGFLTMLGHNELLFYFFFFFVSDSNVLYFYSYDRICTMLELRLDQYVKARDSLIKKDLIAFDGTLFQVLSLPESCLDSKNRQGKKDVRGLAKNMLPSV